tara:strand:+ start:349 stop:537 length:189 start_codon:yes stop_codon:yes gene_type:complete
MTQSPEGLQIDGSWENLVQPAAHPKIPQSTAKSQFSLGMSNPPVSVVGKALQQVGGEIRHGF